MSTDDNDIKKFVESMNVNVIDRPDRLAKDDSKTEDVVEHFLEEINTDLFCVVQPTSPLLNSNSILEGIKLMEVYDSVISVCKDVKYFWSSDGKPINFELGKRKRTQEHKSWFRENGAFYITSKDDFLENKILQNGLVGFIEMTEMESMDIDTKEDLEMVRKLCN